MQQHSTFSMAKPGNALRLSVTGLDIQADWAPCGGWGKERSVCPSVCDGSGWTGRGWPGGGPGVWSVNTADEETGSPRRKGGPGQWGPKTQVLGAKYRGSKTQVLRAKTQVLIAKYRGTGGLCSTVTGTH